MISSVEACGPEDSPCLCSEVRAGHRPKQPLANDISLPNAVGSLGTSNQIKTLSSTSVTERMPTQTEVLCWLNMSVCVPQTEVRQTRGEKKTESCNLAG